MPSDSWATPLTNLAADCDEEQAPLLRFAIRYRGRHGLYEVTWPLGRTVPSGFPLGTLISPLNLLYNQKKWHTKTKHEKNSWLESSGDSSEHSAKGSLGSNLDEVKGRECTSATDSHHISIIHILYGTIRSSGSARFTRSRANTRLYNFLKPFNRASSHFYLQPSPHVPREKNLTLPQFLQLQLLFKSATSGLGFSIDYAHSTLDSESGPGSPYWSLAQSSLGPQSTSQVSTYPSLSTCAINSHWSNWAMPWVW